MTTQHQRFWWCNISFWWWSPSVLLFMKTVWHENFIGDNALGFICFQVFRFLVFTVFRFYSKEWSLKKKIKSVLDSKEPLKFYKWSLREKIKSVLDSKEPLNGENQQSTCTLKHWRKVWRWLQNLQWLSTTSHFVVLEVGVSREKLQKNFNRK